MSDSRHSWFHCGRCGALFQAPEVTDDARRCSVCGADPSPPLPEPPSPAIPAMSHEEAQAKLSSRRGRRSKRRRKNPHTMLKLMLGWLAVLALIILGARKMWHAPAAPTRAVEATSPDAPPVLTSEDLALLQQAAPVCGRVFENFLAAGTPEARNQFVLAPAATAARMARFYSLNPMPTIDPAKLQVTASGLLHLPDGEKAFAAHWTAEDGRIFDVAFRRENDEWRLDWEHFVRYSDYPWSLFLAGSGPEEGEFRLLARERLAEERKTADTISLVLYTPRFGNPGEAGLQSPEFLVTRDSADGRLLDAAFAQARRGGRIFGSSLPPLDPDQMIRLRVKVRRSEGELERKYEITRVLACHWYELDAPGVQPADIAPAESEAPQPSSTEPAPAEPAE